MPCLIPGLGPGSWTFRWHFPFVVPYEIKCIPSKGRLSYPLEDSSRLVRFLHNPVEFSLVRCQPPQFAHLYHVCWNLIAARMAAISLP